MNPPQTKTLKAAHNLGFKDKKVGDWIRIHKPDLVTCLEDKSPYWNYPDYLPSYMDYLIIKGLYEK